MTPPIVLETAANAVQARTRIRSHVFQTPLIPAQNVGKNHGSTVLFKSENFQLTGSFKVRGAMSKMSAQPQSPANHDKDRKQHRLITASSGNHGIGASYAAKILNKDLTVVLPQTVVPSKLHKIQSYGVNTILRGSETGLAEQHAQQLAATQDYTYISPYNDLDVIAGQGSIGLEILEQCAQDSLDNIFVSLGGGGLVSGIGSVIKAFHPSTKVWGVAATNSKALAASMAVGHVVETDHLPTLADAVSGGMDEDSVTLALSMAVVDTVIECSEDEIREALKTIAREENMIVEGSAALALAGWNQVAESLQGQTSVVVLCGANYDRETIMKQLLDR